MGYPHSRMSTVIIEQYMELIYLILPVIILRIIHRLYYLLTKHSLYVNFDPKNEIINLFLYNNIEYVEKSIVNTFDDVRIHYIKIGNGKKKVLLLNGVGTGFFMWYPVLSNIISIYSSIFTTDVTLYVMLYRGLFKQQSNNKIVNIVIDLCIKDIEILRKYESIDKFDTIIGWSTGAQIAVTYVSLYNNLVNKLILLNPSIGMTLHTVLQPFIHLPINIGKYVSVLITNVVIGLKSLIPTIVYEILKYFFESTIFRIILEINAFIGGFPPEQGLYFHSYMYDAMSTRQHTQGLLNLILALDSKNPLDILIDKHIVIQQPTLIFSGYCDFITGIYNSYELIKYLKSYKHIVFTMGSHFLLLEWPEIIAKEIVIFLLDNN